MCSIHRVVLNARKGSAFQSIIAGQTRTMNLQVCFEPKSGRHLIAPEDSPHRANASSASHAEASLNTALPA